MKKPLFALVGIAGGVLLIGAIAKGAIARNLNFVITGLRIGGTVLQPVLYVILGVQNPSSLDYTIQSLSGNVYVNGSLIGNASKFDEVTLKANSQTKYEIAVQMSILVVSTTILALFQGTIAGNLVIQGTVNVEHVPVPIDVTYKII
jgi:LEA14-like dessication related protein